MGSVSSTRESLRDQSAAEIEPIGQTLPQTPAAARLTVVPRQHHGLWVATILSLLLLLTVIASLATNPAFAWGTVASYLFHPSILKGLGLTLLLTIVVMACAIAIGMAIALMRVSSSLLLQGFAGAYVWFFRGVPALIQLIFWFNLALVVRDVSLTLPGLGTVFSVRVNDIMSPFMAAVVALSLCEAGYMAEIIRAGIKSVPHGQTEAASSLGMSYRRTLWRIVVPQAMRFAVPPTGNEAINLLKLTSLVTYIAVNDLFYAAQSIYARTFETIPLLMVVTFWYLLVVSIMSVGQHFLERHYGRSESRRQDGWLAHILRLAIGARPSGAAK